MPVLTDSTTYMAPAITKDTPERESFHKFFDCWLVEQDQHLQELNSAAENHDVISNRAAATESTQASDDAALGSLIDRVIRHYEHYYRAKSRWAEEDVLAMLSPTWRSTLEDAFLWNGGWRPTMAFHLLYSKSGLQLESRLAEVIRGLATGDLADLSPSQLTRVDEMQRRTVKEEREITEKMAALQETVADSSMVELSHAVSEMLRSGGEAGREGIDAEEGRFESTLAPKEEGMEEILRAADDLRLRTLKGVVEILSPIQAVHFLIAAAELHLRLHEWGGKKDAKNHLRHHAPAPGGDSTQQTQSPDSH